jgi:hypothetical protein
MLLSDVVTCKTLNVPSIKVELSLIAFLGRGIGNVDHFAKRTLFLENQTLSSLFLLFFKKNVLCFSSWDDFLFSCSLIRIRSLPVVKATNSEFLFHLCS